ncbi:hypothetical protein Tco_1152538 [Tanacetum coccineum]
MAQQVIPTAQLVPRFHTIRRCNNYAMLQSIPCSPECKIVGQILLDHLLSYDLTATADVPVVYSQQFWRTVIKVPGPKDTIKFMLNTQEFIYTVDMVGYQGVVEKVSAFYIKNLAQPWQTMIEDDYHSIKDDILLVSMYTTENMLVQGMLIPDAFLTEEIRAIDDFKEYGTLFMNVDLLMNQPQLIVSTQGTHRSTPRAHKTPTLTASPQGKKRKQIEMIKRERDAIAKAILLSHALHKTALAAEAHENVAKVQEKLDDKEIEKMFEGKEDEESYASAFVDSVFNDDVDDSSTKLEPGSQKEHPEHVTDDAEEMEKEKKDEEVEKEKEDVDIEKEKDIADDEMGSMEIRKEQN